jgi:SAM-dependent methyltransferase
MLPLIESWAECPACETETPRRALHVQRNRKSPLVNGPYYAVIGCERCGLAYVSPRPTSDALARYYVDEDRVGWTVRHDEAYAAAKEEKKARLADRVVAPILRARGPGRALDVGCGAGDILNALQKAGWETVGIEPHAARRAIAAHQHRLIEDIPREPTFDLIIFHHVLEHVLAPCDLLRAARAAALPDAHLLVGVPAFEDVAVTGNLARACGPVHINGFTGPALRNAITMAGWAVASLAGKPLKHDRHVVYAVATGPPQPPEPRCLDEAVAVLRQYGRRLDRSGEFVTAVSESAD